MAEPRWLLHTVSFIRFVASIGPYDVYLDVHEGVLLDACVLVKGSVPIEVEHFSIDEDIVDHVNETEQGEWAEPILALLKLEMSNG